MNKHVVFWGAIGLMILSVSFGVVLLYVPGVIFNFYYIKPEYLGPLVIGSTFGHIATLIVIASVQKWVAKRYGSKEMISHLTDLEPPE